MTGTPTHRGPQMSIAEEHIRRRILIPFNAALLLIVASSFMGIYWLQRQEIEKNTETALNGFHSAFAAALQKEAEMIEGPVAALKADEGLEQAWQAQDRAAVLERTRPVFEALRKDYAVTQLDFFQPDGTTYLHVPNAARVGGAIAPSFIAHRKDGEDHQSALNVDIDGTPLVSTVYPWRVGGRVAGYISVGQPLGHVTPFLADMLNAELIFCLETRFVAGAGTSPDSRWRRIGDFVVVDHTLDTLPDEVLATVEKHHHDHGRFFLTLAQTQRTYNGGVLPLTDAGGRTIGDVLLLRDITNEKTTLRDLSATLVGIYASVAGVFFVFSFFYVGKIQKRLAESYRGLQNEIAERQRAEQTLARHRDDLEQRVEERTQTIQAAYRQLQQETTERLKTEEELNRFKTTLDKTLDCVFMFRADTLKFFYVNQGAVDQVGYSAAELMEMTPVHIEPEFDRQKFDAMIAPLIDGTKNALTFETVHEHKSGRRISVEISLQYVDPGGEPPRFVAIVRDITERRRTEDTLRELNETLEQRVAKRARELEEEKNFIATVLETQAALVVVLDNTGRVVSFNRACEEVTGYGAADVQGHFVWDLFIPEDERDGIKAVFADLTVGRARNKHDNVWLTKDGDRCLISWSNSAIVDEAGAVRYVIATGIDITQRKAAEQALLEAKEVAEKASGAKSEFLSRMSHELRTPMNAILGFAQLLEADTSQPLSLDQQDMLQEILHAGNHLLELINEVLDLARIESGHLRLAMKNVELAPVLHECIALINPLAEQRRMRLAQQLADSCATFVRADRVRLKEVIINLLSNAVKYNRPQGAITLDCNMTDTGRVRISVADTGRGIRDEHKGRLFQPFERLDAGGEVEGTGIGLALTKQLMEMMDGSVGVESRAGEGSTFWIELQAGEATERAATHHEPIRARNIAAGHGPRTVLYVEDNPANLKLVAQLLEKRPSVILLNASTAGLGIELAVAHRPTLILLDINLPDMDGYAVLRRLQETPGTRHIPIVAVSAKAMAADVERGLDMGFAAYLTKPLDLEAFYATVDGFLG